MTELVLDHVGNGDQSAVSQYGRGGAADAVPGPTVKVRPESSH